MLIFFGMDRALSRIKNIVDVGSRMTGVLEELRVVIVAQ